MSSMERLCFSPTFSDKAKYRYMYDKEAKPHCIRGWVPSKQQTGRSFNYFDVGLLLIIYSDYVILHGQRYAKW